MCNCDITYISSTFMSNSHVGGPLVSQKCCILISNNTRNLCVKKLLLEMWYARFHQFMTMDKRIMECVILCNKGCCKGHLKEYYHVCFVCLFEHHNICSNKEPTWYRDVCPSQNRFFTPFFFPIWIAQSYSKLCSLQRPLLIWEKQEHTLFWNMWCQPPLLFMLHSTS